MKGLNLKQNGPLENIEFWEGMNEYAPDLVRFVLITENKFTFIISHYLLLVMSRLMTHLLSHGSWSLK